MATYLIEFGALQGTRPVPPLTVTAADDDALCRAVTDHARPHITPVLSAMGRPELADCLFRLAPDGLMGHFEWLDLASGDGARFLGARITPCGGREVAETPAADRPSTPAAIIELEAAGCRTWHLTPRDLSRIDDEIDQYGVYAKGYWEQVDGKLAVTGLRVGSGPDRVVARFGDWLVRHPDGRWSVHSAAARTVEETR